VMSAEAEVAKIENAIEQIARDLRWKKSMRLVPHSVNTELSVELSGPSG
jgi:hypothetical protein